MQSSNCLLCLLLVAAAATLNTLSVSGLEPLVMDPVGYSFKHPDSPKSKVIIVEDGTNPTVNIPVLGTAKGRTLQTLFGRNFSAFHSIPYAPKPERFLYPTLWNDVSWSEDISQVYDATYFRDKCAQHSLIAPSISGSEDCLHLSIYVPQQDFTDPLPVMVFIHGGAYMSGEADMYMPSKLMDQDVVVVVLQYRLGTLGFLYSGTLDAPGNMGLMDQVTALRWVNQFISNFGGDPGLVTVFGQSAGGASTSWMQITPLTRAENNDGVDLAQRFIPMSGSAFEYWTLENDPENSFLLQVSEAGCDNTTDKSEMVNCMKELSMEDVVWASLRVYRADRLAGGLGFAGQVPVVQEAAMGSELELVIVESPLDSIRSGRFLQVPTMIGSVRDEGSLVTGLMYDDYLLPHNLTDDENFLKNDLFQILAQAFGIQDITKGVANSFRLGFQPEGQLTGVWDDMAGGVVDVTGMLFLKSGLWNLAHEIQAFNAEIPVFFYSFEFESDDSLFDWIFFSSPDLPIVGGISHGDDLMYLFNMPCYFDEREREMVVRMTTLYTNFAKYGSPTPSGTTGSSGDWIQWSDEWQTYDPLNQPFMLLADDFTMMQDFTTRWNHNRYGYPAENPSSKVAAPKAVDAEDSDDSVISSGGSAEAANVGALVAAVLGMVALVAVAVFVGTAVVVKRRRQGSDTLALVETSQ